MDMKTFVGRIYQPFINNAALLLSQAQAGSAEAGTELRKVRPARAGCLPQAHKPIRRRRSYSGLE
jgi:hypothetical protein